MQYARKPVRKQEHDRGADSTEGEEGPKSYGEGSPRLHLSALGMRFAYHPRQRNRKSGSSQHQKDAVNIIRRNEQTVSVITQQITDGYLVDCAEDLHYNNTGGQNCRTVQIVLFLCFSHGLSPYAYQFKT